MLSLVIIRIKFLALIRPRGYVPSDGFISGTGRRRPRRREELRHDSRESENDIEVDQNTAETGETDENSDGSDSENSNQSESETESTAPPEDTSHESPSTQSEPRPSVRPKRKRLQRLLLASSEDEERPGPSSAIDPLTQIDTRSRPSSRQTNSSTKSRLRADPAQIEIENTHLNWISHTQALRSPFIPQIGDYCVYVPAAHQKYCDDLEKKLKCQLRHDDKIPKWFKKSENYNREFKCKIEKVDIEMCNLPIFPKKPLRWIVLKLDFSANPITESKEKIEKLTVKFAPLSDCEEFLVFGPLYDQSVRQRYRKEFHFGKKF